MSRTIVTTWVVSTDMAPSFPTLGCARYPGHRARPRTVRFLFCAMRNSSRPSCPSRYRGLRTYCNRADTCWYRMDKGTPPDQPKPPKQAQFPDAPVRARTCASKLLMSRSAVRVRSSALYFIAICRKNVTAKTWIRISPSLTYRNRSATRLATRRRSRCPDSLAYTPPSEKSASSFADTSIHRSPFSR
jgi:hypothetical protein